MAGDTQWKAYGTIVEQVELIFSPKELSNLWISKSDDSSGKKLSQKIEELVENSSFWKTTKSLASARREYGPLLKPINECASSAIFEFHVGSLMYAWKNGLSSEQANIVASLFAHILRSSIRKKSEEDLGDILTQQETFLEFRNILLDLYRAGCFTNRAQCESIVEFISQSFFKVYKLYQYNLAQPMDRIITRARHGTDSLTLYGTQFFSGVELDCFDHTSAPPDMVYEGMDGQNIIQEGCLKGFRRKTKPIIQPTPEVKEQPPEEYDWRAHGNSPLEDQGAEDLINEALERTVDRTEDRLKRLSHLKQKRKLRN